MADPTNVEQIPAGGGGNPNPAGAGGNNNPNPNPAAVPAATPTGSGYKIGTDGSITTHDGKKVYTYTEDRGDYVPRHRLNEVTTKHQTVEQQLTQVKADLEREQKRVRSLAGVDPANPQAQEEEEVANTIIAMVQRKFPWMTAKSLEKLTGEQFDQVVNGSMAGQSAQDAAADSQRDAAFESCCAEAAKLLRKDTLSARQTRSIREAFATEFRSAMQARHALRKRGDEPDPNDFVGRYLRNDKTLFAQFAKEYLADWYDDAKRNVTATTVRRQNRPVPNGGRGETVITSMPKHDLTTKDGFKRAMVEARNASQAGA